jgi:anti-anti-sigma factor
MGKDLEILTNEKDGVSVISLKGDVTAITGESIEETYKEISSSGSKKILFHFDKDCYINSGGIAILIGIAAESKSNEQVIHICGLSDHFQKIFHMVGLTKYTKIFPTEEAALNDF